ncbi:hypothetical protein SEPCBS57363_005878 [Sporothrix epigloea]|uniref:Carboxylesterase family protein n=1 Tax=Sporothrix epigloea TaxID=1892477 RepID=A0ABP0E415_9PEZI
MSLSRSSVTGNDREVNTYTLIATPLTSRKEVNDLRDSNRQTDLLSPSLRLTSSVVADMPPTEAGGDFSKASALSPNPVPVGRQQSLPRSSNGSVARIEDTLEELDRLEDEFEAVHSMVRVSRVATPDKKVYDKASTNSTKRLDPRNDTHDLQPTEVEQAASARRSIGAVELAEKSVAAGSASASPITKRLNVARPRSLLPPKPSAKSSKPPTVSTFELPGEAISRRKREEHEAKVKQQMKEEEKRREFKARPIRLNNTPISVPRETISSRARTNRASVDSEAASARTTLSVPSSAPQANRRRSELESSNNTRLEQTPRGRGTSLKRLSTAAGSVSRATSTSTCSVSGKRSTFLSEDVQNQKLRGREILQRDSILSSHREREKREREAITKQARQQAAERSRALSREWAEKQKLKAKITATASAKS